jgi:hypothetical protein
MFDRRSLSSLVVAAAVLAALASCSSAGAEGSKSSSSGKNAATTSAQTQKAANAGKNAGTTAVADSTAATSAPKIIVYYFHGNARCPTCYMLENYAKQALDASFGDALKDGRIDWKVVNVEEGGNEHFGQDYSLYTKSVIISIRKDGKEASWKNLDQIWQLVHNEQTYKDYITREVKACLEGKCL